MKFTKMEGLGNDYVYVNCLEEQIADPSKTAIEVSDRHFGIGSDGLILIKPSDKADFFMEMYNADGSQGKMCGNGIRCVGKFVYDYGLTDKTEITVDTLAGIKYLSLNVENKAVKSVRVNMGKPEFTPALIPVKADGDGVIDKELLKLTERSIKLQACQWVILIVLHTWMILRILKLKKSDLYLKMTVFSLTGSIQSSSKL